MGGTRNPVKQWEITFPQVADATTKETFHESFPPSDYSICCCEKHEDGGFHLHMGIVFKKGISKANLLDWVIAKFPCDYKRIHLSGIRAMAKWQDYCKKEDPEVFERGSIEKKKKYTEADAVRDVMNDIMLNAKIRGEQNAYLYSEENYIRQKGIDEMKWLETNGYV